MTIISTAKLGDTPDAKETGPSPDVRNAGLLTYTIDAYYFTPFAYASSISLLSAKRRGGLREEGFVRLFLLQRLR